MKRIISAATEDKDTRLDDALSTLGDDFDYCVSGLEKLGTDGKTEDALAIANELSNGIGNIIKKIAKLVSSSGE